MKEKEVKFSLKTNLLEEEPYCYELKDSPTPNLYREIFPYSEIPKLPFNHRYITPDMPDNIFITDTTFRDGQQSIVPYTVKQIEKIFDYLHKLGGKNGIIKQTEFFVYSKKDKEAIYKCMEKGYDFPEITTWIRASKKDFELVKNIGIKETGILISCSDYHIYNKLHMTRKQAYEYYVSIVTDIIDAGLRPRCHLEDVTRADVYGFVIPLINKFKEIADDTGVPVKIRLCDTLGLGIPFSGTILPRSVPGIVSCIKHFCDLESENIEWHGHNDFYFGVANAMAAWLYGASAVNCSLLGIGERTGNVPLEAMIFNYAALRGSLDGMDTTVITDIAEFYNEEIGYKIGKQTPFVGKNFNVTKAGIHADGILKDEEIYNIFDTKKFLKRPAGVALTQTSGLAGITYWYNNHYQDKKPISKNDNIIKHIKYWIDRQYNMGRQTSITDQELYELIDEYNEEKEKNE